ncbi:hypothetical protein [Propionispora vibrioides]|uniref:Uncharacterized protein n=1 Tax=Propionispora vibrioides TaxID=112903 RepID=A0A1H8Y4R5_9FIRM|nr:hypothetical protein [Propionispora vibrioides]SEP46981.1 hypothetical protein SAMN04490178_14210 [Propionispora vibrioides]
MMFTVDAENIVYVTFLKEYKNQIKTERKAISIEQIKRFTEKAQAVMNDCNFEISENSICSAVEFYSNIFEWRNDKITFVSEYENKFHELEAVFSRRLPNRVSKALQEIVQAE